MLQNTIGKLVLIHLNDNAICSSNAIGPILHLRIVVEQLHSHKLYAKLSECKFAKS